jgi:hypothetical protein
LEDARDTCTSTLRSMAHKTGIYSNNLLRNRVWRFSVLPQLGSGSCMTESGQW